MGKKTTTTGKKRSKTSGTISKLNKTIKAGDTNELKTELDRLNELNKKKPAKLLGNKSKRRELVYMRNNVKNRIKSKLRRSRQKQREATGEEIDEANKPKTIDMMREHDDTFVDTEGQDEELVQENENDEFSGYFNKEYEPSVLLTTSIKHTGAIFKFMKELKELIPNSYFYYRKKYNLKDIIEIAKEKGITDVIVVYERLRKPYRMTITHLPDGPTAEFKIFNVIYKDQLEDHAKSTEHNPELIFKGFKTKVGYRLSRMLNSLFPHNEEVRGRQVVTFHNQRDYIFFRYHRYIFNEDFTGVNLQEIGPRFVLRLLSIQKGTFDREFGEYEWYYKNKMGVRRRKFNL
jgi:ribosome production factor 1